MKFCYSTDEETFYGDFASREDALRAAIESLEGVEDKTRKVQTAQCQPRTILDYFQMDDLAERLGELADEEVGEASEHWLVSVSSEAIRELSTFIDQWATSHGLQPTFGGLAEVQYHEVKVPQ